MARNTRRTELRCFVTADPKKGSGKNNNLLDTNQGTVGFGRGSNAQAATTQNRANFGVRPQLWVGTATRQQQSGRVAGGSTPCRRGGRGNGSRSSRRPAGHPAAGRGVGAAGGRSRWSSIRQEPGGPQEPPPGTTTSPGSLRPDENSSASMGPTSQGGGGGWPGTVLPRQRGVGKPGGRVEFPPTPPGWVWRSTPTPVGPPGGAAQGLGIGGRGQKETKKNFIRSGCHLKTRCGGSRGSEGV